MELDTLPRPPGRLTQGLGERHLCTDCPLLLRENCSFGMELTLDALPRFLLHFFVYEDCRVQCHY